MRNTQRLLSLLLAVIMILGTLTIGTLSISADAWDGTTATAPTAGDGSESNPYQIASAENLAWLSAQVKAGEDYEGKYFLQTADIDLNNKAFTPIGTVLVLTEKATTAGAPMIDEDLTVAFKGTYDGGDFAIKNATIAADENEIAINSNFISEVDTIYGAGIFGAAMEATIKNVNAENIVVGTFDASEGATATLDQIYTVGVAGVIVGIASNIDVDRCTTDADSAAYGAWAAGGMVGFTFRNPDYNDGEGKGTVITRCINDATVKSDFVAGGMVGGGALQEASFCVNNGSIATYTVKQNETFAGGMMGYGTGLANPNTDFKYCLNSAEAEMTATSYCEGLSRRRGYTAGILGCEGNETTTYLFSHCYNLMEEIYILDYMVNDAAGLSNILSGSILGQIKGSANTFVATFDYSMSVLTVRDVYGKPTLTGENCVAPSQELSMGKYGQAGSEIAGLVNGRGNGGSAQFCVPTTNAAGVSTCDYAVTVDEMKEKSAKVVAAFEFFENVLDVNLEGGIPSLTVDNVRYAGVQETQPANGKVEVRLIGVVDEWINEAQGFIVSVSTAEDETLYTATKLLRSVRGGGKTYTPQQLDLGIAAYAISIGEIPAEGDVVINVTPFVVEMGDDVETDRKMGAAWAITYKDGAFVKHLPDDGSIVEDTQIELDLVNGNDIEGDGWQGMADYTKPTQGTGTEADPFLIEKAEHLAWLAWAVKESAQGVPALLGENAPAEIQTRKVFTGIYFKQTADIDLNNQKFMPIGLKQATEDYTTRIAFAGNYDGDGHAIKNAEIKVSDHMPMYVTESYAEAYVTGLFGFVSGGSVKNLNAENVKVGKSNPNAIMLVKTFTENVAGTIVGLAIKSTIENCSTDASCEVHGVRAGGIVGVAIDATVIRNCENNATVVGHTAAGGIAGAFEGTLDFCVNNGNVKGITYIRWAGFGGIMGAFTNATAQTNKISNCINTGAIDVIEKKGGASDNHRAALGGIVGNDKDIDKGLVQYENLFNLATHFTAAFTASGNSDVLAASGGIVGISEDTQATKDPANAYKNLWSVTGTTTEDHFGQSTYERLWANENDTPNLYPYAGICTGRMTMAQHANSLGIATEDNEGWQEQVNAAFATCYYGKTVAEIEACAEYQAILAVFAD